MGTPHKMTIFYDSK